MKKEKIIFIISLVMMLLATSISVYATSCLYNSSDVSYTAPSGSGLSANVQDSLTEVYGHCTDYTSMDTRVSSLEGHFQNNAISVFNGSMLNIKSSDSNSSRGLDIRDASDTARSYLYYSPSYDRVYLTSNNSSGTAGAGSLDIQGNPVMINGEDVTKINSISNMQAVSGSNLSYYCFNGTIDKNELKYKIVGNNFLLVGRMVLNVSSRTCGNPGVTITIPNGRTISSGFDIQTGGYSSYSDSPRNGEGTFISGSAGSSTFRLSASESYANVSNNKKLVLYVPTISIPLN